MTRLQFCVWTQSLNDFLDADKQTAFFFFFNSHFLLSHIAADFLKEYDFLSCFLFFFRLTLQPSVLGKHKTTLEPHKLVDWLACHGCSSEEVCSGWPGISLRVTPTPSRFPCKRLPCSSCVSLRGNDASRKTLPVLRCRSRMTTRKFEPLEANKTVWYYAFVSRSDF